MKSAIKNYRNGPFYDQWHKWFAWYPVPVEVSECQYRYVWLETVERKVNFGDMCGDTTEYRELPVAILTP